MRRRAEQDRPEALVLARQLVDSARRDLDSNIRNSAADGVLGYLHRHGRAVLDGASGYRASREELDAAEQEVMIAVLRGGFRGGSDAQAAAWLASVLRNALRKEARMRRRHPTVALRDNASSEVVMISDGAALREVVQAAVSVLGEEIRRGARPRDALSLVNDWDLAASSALGETTAQQVMRLGARWLSSARRTTRQTAGDETRAAAARIRQRRQRGRRAALHALHRLRCAGSWDSDWDPALEVLGLGGNRAF